MNRNIIRCPRCKSILVTAKGNDLNCKNCGLGFMNSKKVLEEWRKINNDKDK